tara:strand:- start:571 stop:1419 length:849 start_codon:yes stop_codon:yes gene_type:complete
MHTDSGTKEERSETTKVEETKTHDLSDLLHQLFTLQVHIAVDDSKGMANTKLGTINGHRLFMKSETFTAMLQESTVVDNAVTFTFPDNERVTEHDVKTFDKMLEDKHYVKILSSESVFDDFRNPSKTPTEVQMDLKGTALSPGVLTLIDFFELDGLKERIVELTNKKPTLERILSVDGMQHAEPWMGYAAANVVAGRIADVSLDDSGLTAVQTNAVKMSEITDDLDKMRLEYETLQSVTAILAYMLKTMKSHQGHRHHGTYNTPPDMQRRQRHGEGPRDGFY